LFASTSGFTRFQLLTLQFTGRIDPVGHRAEKSGLMPCFFGPPELPVCLRELEVYLDQGRLHGCSAFERREPMAPALPGGPGKYPVTNAEYSSYVATATATHTQTKSGVAGFISPE